MGYGRDRQSPSFDEGLWARRSSTLQETFGHRASVCMTVSPPRLQGGQMAKTLQRNSLTKNPTTPAAKAAPRVPNITASV